MNKLSSLCRTLCPLLVAASCTNEATPQAEIDGDLEGIEEAAEGLTDLTAKCVWVSPNATLTLTSGDVAMISKLSSGALGINGYACGSATVAALKKLTIREDANSTGPQSVIIDYLGGVFGAGTATGVGLDVDLGTGTDALKFRGTKQADTFVFGSAGIVINADTIKDVVFANVENFVVTLTDGDDSFSGAGNAVTGGSTAFTLAVTVYGGAGNDTLRGGDGADTLNGGLGNDTFTTGAAADGSDALSGGGGTDTADYSTRTAAVTLLNDGVAHSGADTGGGAGTENDNIAADVLTLKGGMGNDTITGGTGADVIFGGPGDDTIAGGLAANILWGDAGNDTFNEGTAISTGEVINGGAGTDVVSYAARTMAVLVTLDATANDGESGETDKVMIDVENVVGGAGGDTITGSAVDNVLDGGGGGDTLLGGLGNDRLIGGLGADSLRGEAGDDVFAEGDVSNGADTMVGGLGIDVVDYSARTVALVIVMDATTTNGVTTGTNSGEAPLGVSEGDLISTDIENLVGGTEADSITGNAFDNQLEGGSGDIVDTINGMAGDDTVDGGLGDDIVDCGDGEDLVLDLTLDAASQKCEL